MNVCIKELTVLTDAISQSSWEKISVCLRIGNSRFPNIQASLTVYQRGIGRIAERRGLACRSDTLHANRYSSQPVQNTHHTTNMGASAWTDMFFTTQLNSTLPTSFEPALSKPYLSIMPRTTGAKLLDLPQRILNICLHLATYDSVPT